MKNILRIEIDSKRVFGLDILRAFAIMFVVIDHGSFLLPEKFRFLPTFFVFDGVSIFFVLSGFLIGGILIKIIQEKGFSFAILKSFWVRRWFRTLPNYLLILVIICLLNLLFEKDFIFENVSKYFYFSQNLFEIHPKFFSEAWSLSIEEWFYLILPIMFGIVLTIFKKSYKKGILIACISIIILVTLFRYFRFLNVTLNNPNDWDLLFRKQVSTRLDSLMFGVVGAYVNYYHQNYFLKHKTKLFVIGILLFLISKFIFPLFIEFDSLFSCVFSFSIISIGSLFLIPFLTQIKSGKGFLYKPITYVSLISYSMYLINLTLVQTWMLDKIDWRNLIHNEYLMGSIRYFCYWFLVILISILLYKYFEIPMTSLRDKIKKNRTNNN